MYILWDALKDLCSFWSDARTKKKNCTVGEKWIFFFFQVNILKLCNQLSATSEAFSEYLILKHFLIYLCITSLFMWFAEGFRGDISKPSPVKGAWIFIIPFKSPPILGRYVFSSITPALLLCSASVNPFVSTDHIFYCFLLRDSVINKTANMGCTFSDGNSLRLGMWKHI